MEKGLWIVITGLDGTGKTTLKKNLSWYFRRKNLIVKDFKFPYDKNLLDLMNNVIGDGLPLKDNYTDQMLFALDNRILGMTLIKKWRISNDVLISQRSYLDSFVHGECRGFSYRETDELQRTWELERCQVMIHLNADPIVAFERIKNDPDADKSETLDYIKNQAKATKRAYEHLIQGHPDLSAFKGIPNIYVDTTSISCEQTFKIVLRKLKEKAIID